MTFFIVQFLPLRSSRFGTLSGGTCLHFSPHYLLNLSITMDFVADMTKKVFLFASEIRIEIRHDVL